MSKNYLEDIHFSKNLIILIFKHRRIYLYDYDITELKLFLISYIFRYSFDIGVIDHFVPKNSKKYPNGFLRLVCSPFYQYIDGKCIETQLTGDTENDTITLFNNLKKPIYVFSLFDDKLFQFLYYILENGLYQDYNNLISSLKEYQDFKYDKTMINRDLLNEHFKYSFSF